MAKADEGGLGRWEEVINGTIHMMEPADFETHQNLVHKVIQVLKNQLENTAYKVYGSGVGLEIDMENNFVPDAFIALESMIKEEGGVAGTPYLLAEVISQETQDRDRGYKKDLYAKVGIKEYWVVSPYSNSLEVYHLTESHLDSGSYLLKGTYAGKDSFDTYGLAGYHIDVSQIF